MADQLHTINIPALQREVFNRISEYRFKQAITEVMIEWAKSVRTKQLTKRIAGKCEEYLSERLYSYGIKASYFMHGAWGMKDGKNVQRVIMTIKSNCVEAIGYDLYFWFESNDLDAQLVIDVERSFQSNMLYGQQADLLVDKLNDLPAAAERYNSLLLQLREASMFGTSNTRGFDEGLWPLAKPFGYYELTSAHAPHTNMVPDAAAEFMPPAPRA